MFHYLGENPRGFWQLKLIDNPLNEIGDRVLNGFGTLHLDTSKQDTDVEDLEEQVIDDQTKQQQTHVQQLKLQVSPQACNNNVVTRVLKKTISHTTFCNQLGTKNRVRFRALCTGCTFSHALCRWRVFARLPPDAVSLRLAQVTLFPAPVCFSMLVTGCVFLLFSGTACTFSRAWQQCHVLLRAPIDSLRSFRL